MILGLLACTGVGTPTDDSEVPGPVLCDGTTSGTRISIQPYLQQMTPTSTWVLWETDAGTASAVQYGTEAMDQHVCASQVPAIPGLAAASEVHEAELTELQPATRYRYRVQTGSLQSAEFFFTTPALPSAEANFQLVAMGDSQRDDDHPFKFKEMVEEGVIPTVVERYGPELDQSIAMVLFAGDLVDNGWLMSEWVDDFFGQGQQLWSRVPLYPVLGNHEGNSPLYFRYFHLPLDEHVYTIDHSNVRVIGLDSNGSFQTDTQLQWLAGVLDDTCTNTDIDFVFAQLHHPHLSELWTPGNTLWSGAVVDQLTEFSDRCGKPSIHFFGHTHGYSRGADRNHQHLMVNVSSAGGRLDRWGGQDQADYDEYAVTEDEYGFVVVEVQAGEQPAFEVLRFSRGTPEHPRNNELTDRIRVRKHNQPPATPMVTASCNPLSATATPFSDLDGDTHQGTEWEVTDCSGHVLATRWRQHTNRYAGVDTQANDDLTDEQFDEVTTGCVRVRYRDAGLVWSEWSPSMPCVER